MNQARSDVEQVRELGNLTFPVLAWRHAAARPQASAMREKRLGIWQSLDWRELKVQAEALAAGLAGLGLARGAHVALVGENRPRLYVAMLAVQSLGAIPVPLYQDAAAAEMAYVCGNADIAFAIVEYEPQRIVSGPSLPWLGPAIPPSGVMIANSRLLPVSSR